MKDLKKLNRNEMKTVGGGGGNSPCTASGYQLYTMTFVGVVSIPTLGCGAADATCAGAYINSYAESCSCAGE